jgi:hypothetical protein
LILLEYLSKTGFFYPFEPPTCCTFYVFLKRGRNNRMFWEKSPIICVFLRNLIGCINTTELFVMKLKYIKILYTQMTGRAERSWQIMNLSTQKALKLFALWRWYREFYPIMKLILRLKPDNGARNGWKHLLQGHWTESLEMINFLPYLSLPVFHLSKKKVDIPKKISPDFRE